MALDDTADEVRPAWLSEVTQISRRIRLTGLLRKTPANAGVFYIRQPGESSYEASDGAPSAVSPEPLDAGARPFAVMAVPASSRIARARVPARADGLKAMSRRLQQLFAFSHQGPTTPIHRSHRPRVRIGAMSVFAVVFRGRPSPSLATRRSPSLL